MLIQLYTLLFFSSLHDIVQSEQQVSMGTTIVAVRYRDGIVVGADTRTSVSGYVSNRYATKVSFVMEQDDFGLKLDLPSDIQTRSSLKKKKRVENNKHEEKEHNDEHTESEELQSTTTMRPKTFLDSSSLSCSTCCICRSGSAADTQYLADAVRHQILKRRILNRSKSSISNVAHLIKNYLYNNDLQASLICAGYDHMRGTGVIYSIELGGTIVEQPYYACSGSGSGYVIGYIDDRLMSDTSSSRTTNNGLLVTTEEEAIELVGNSIELAMDRDGSSGGVVRIYVMDRNGKREMIRVPSRKLMVSNTGTAAAAAGGDDWKNDDTLPLTTTSSASSSSNLSKFAPAQRPTG